MPQFPKSRPFPSKIRKRTARAKGIRQQRKQISLNKVPDYVLEPSTSTGFVSRSNCDSGSLAKDASNSDNSVETEIVSTNDNEFDLPLMEIEQDCNPPEEIDSLLKGRRIVNLGHVLKAYENVILHPQKCTMGKMMFSKETRQGLHSILHFYCDNCEKTISITTEPSETSKEEINESLVWGSFSIGIGHSQCEEFLAVLNVPSMTSKTFVKYSGCIKKTWEEHLLKKMKLAGEEEKRLALEKGQITADGTPYITVIGDGGWSKRSYGHGYCASGGVGIIIGAATKKPLFLGVRNKVCSMCYFYKSKHQEPKQHECFLNYSGPSTAMEQDIIVEGFSQSIEQHGLIYKYYIGDGDSSVYARIVERVSYGRSVGKIECANHMTRCISDKLHKLSTNTSFPISARRLLTQKIEGISRLERLVKGVRMAIKDAGNKNDVNQLRTDIGNATNHVFGKHTLCRDSYCKRKNNGEVDVVLDIQDNGIYIEIQKILDPIIRKADRVAFNETTNQAERYMGLVAKFIGGKRINFTKRGSYAIRTYGAALSHFSGPGWHLSPWKNSRGREPGETFTKIVGKRATVSCKRRLRFAKTDRFPKRKKMANNKTGPDQNYGPESAEADITESTLVSECEKFLDGLKLRVSSLEDQENIEKATKGQHENNLWREIRKDCLTASNFGAVCKRRSKTHCHNLVKRLLYGKEINTAAVIFGRTNEKKAVDAYEKLHKKPVERCGIFIDIQHPYLGASPDGLLGDNGIVEIKCMPSLGKQKIIDVSTKGRCFEIISGEIRLKKNHNYYYQVQGQLNITKREFCDFIIYTECDFAVQRIRKDERFWQNEMLPKLQSFYLACILPEIVDGRLPRGMKIRDPNLDVHQAGTSADENILAVPLLE